MDINNFIRKKSYENIVAIIRRHPFTFLKTIIFFLVLFAVPALLYWLVNQLFPDLLAGRIIYPLAVMALSVYLLFVIVLFYSFFIDFYLDEMIITNDRLIDIEQNGLLARTIAETDLYLIQDVTSEIKGLFASIFKYGRVVIQTAGATPKFIVVDIPDPNGLRRLLLDLASEDKKFHNII
ncbi:MAG TPA: PH domain-containing protein, partial [Patescibacteria group bacterium]|nr:PH domain-containing protein [Patescibacteria group bacterium]